MSAQNSSFVMYSGLGAGACASEAVADFREAIAHLESADESA